MNVRQRIHFVVVVVFFVFFTNVNIYHLTLF